MPCRVAILFFLVLCLTGCDDKKKASTAACGAGTPDRGFHLTPVISDNDLPSVIDVAFLPQPQGAFIVISQNGAAAYYSGENNLVNTIDLSQTDSGIGVVDGGEQGLLNIELHPDFAQNGFIFFYHTVTDSSRNAVSRMHFATDAGGAMQLSDPVRIITMRKNSGASNHNGGGLVFAPDGSLLASVGDGGGGRGDNARTHTNLLGAVIRIFPGLTPGAGGYTQAQDLHYSGNASCDDLVDTDHNCPELLAKGLRNPFRMSIDGTTVYIADVGLHYKEEIDRFQYSENDVDFGWNTHEGTTALSDIAGYRNPLLEYDRDADSAAQFRLPSV